MSVYLFVCMCGGYLLLNQNRYQHAVFAKVFKNQIIVSPSIFKMCLDNISATIGRKPDTGGEKSAKNRLFWVVLRKIKGVNDAELP